jgi:hypothetical protein
MDDDIGVMLKKLGDMGQLDNAIVVFTYVYLAAESSFSHASDPMKNSATNNDLSVNAIASSFVVVLGINNEEPMHACSCSH